MRAILPRYKCPAALIAGALGSGLFVAAAVPAFATGHAAATINVVAPTYITAGQTLRVDVTVRGVLPPATSSASPTSISTETTRPTTSTRRTTSSSTATSTTPTTASTTVTTTTPTTGTTSTTATTATTGTTSTTASTASTGTTSTTDTTSTSSTPTTPVVPALRANGLALVAAPTGIPASGTVAIFDGQHQIGSGSLNAKGETVIAADTRRLAIGLAHLTVNFTGDALFGPSSIPISVNVVEASAGTSSEEASAGTTSEIESTSSLVEVTNQITEAGDDPSLANTGFATRNWLVAALMLLGAGALLLLPRRWRSGGDRQH